MDRERVLELFEWCCRGEQGSVIVFSLILGDKKFPPGTGRRELRTFLRIPHTFREIR